MIDKPYSISKKRVWVAGHGGMAGSALSRRLADLDCCLLQIDRKSLDLARQSEVEAWLHDQRPDVVFLAAAKVGGIHANATFPVDFLGTNLAIQTNVISTAHKVGVERLVFLGSSCIYPKRAPQPMTEDALLTGPLEPTNEPYAIAKIAGLKLCEAYRRQYGRRYISVMPTNLYGPGDNFHPQNSHVPAALLDRFHMAKINRLPEVSIWGTGTPLREFMHVDDFADACVFVATNYDGAQHVNIGTGEEISILEFARRVANVVGYEGQIICDTSRPDGAPRKLLDCQKLRGLGWRASRSLDEGLQSYYDWYLNYQSDLKR